MCSELTRTVWAFSRLPLLNTIEWLSVYSSMLLLLSPLMSDNLSMQDSELNMSHLLPAPIRSQVPSLSSDTINHIFIPDIPCVYENSIS